jgi:hypothetical protein
MSNRKFSIAYDICHEVLSQVGQNIPETVYMYQTTAMTKTAARMVEGLSDKDLLAMKEMEPQLATVMSFYAVMMRAAVLAKPEMLPFLAYRMVQLTMENGLCMDSLTGFIVLAALLCKKSMGGEIDILCATKIGKAAISCLSQRYNAEKIPVTYSLYYFFVAWHSEPLQICAEKLRRGFEVGMSLGESHTAFCNSIQQVTFDILAGERLPALLQKVDYYLGLANIYKDDFGKTCFSFHRHTIEILIGGGESWWVDIKLQCLALLPAKVLENLYFFSALKTYWQGHNKRCKYYVEKMLTVIATSNQFIAGPQTYYFIVFINGLNTFELMKSHQTATAMRKLKSTAVKALAVLKVASEYSSWNFQNKVRYVPCLFLFIIKHYYMSKSTLVSCHTNFQVQLLEAELKSHEGKHDEAMAFYVASIKSAKASGFNSEQGLACELAGNHCKLVSNMSGAENFLIQARMCYTEWGSQMRVQSIDRQLVLIKRSIRDAFQCGF